MGCLTDERFIPAQTSNPFETCSPQMSLPHAVVWTGHHSARVPPFNAAQVQAAARIVNHEVAADPSENQFVTLRPLQTECA